MAEWLRCWTRNPMGFPRAGSNPARDELLPVYSTPLHRSTLSTHNSLLRLSISHVFTCKLLHTDPPATTTTRSTSTTNVSHKDAVSCPVYYALPLHVCYVVHDVLNMHIVISDAYIDQWVFPFVLVCACLDERD